jgi:Sec-independent protein secretion pathway component TatC
MTSTVTAIFTHATEAFSTYLKLILLAGALSTFPVFVIELYLFLRPGLFAQEDRQSMAPMCI